MRVPVGGAQDRVEIHLIAHPDEDQTEARRLLTEQFATFNAGKAQCFLASDREHLLAVIEAGFGDFDDFNRIARNLLAMRVLDRNSSTWDITVSTNDEPAGTVTVRVLRATSLMAADMGGSTPDAFVVVQSAGGKKEKTSIKKNTVSPSLGVFRATTSWDETLELSVYDMSAPLSFEVWDHGKIGMNDSLGAGEVLLAQCAPGTPTALRVALSTQGEIEVVVTFSPAPPPPTAASCAAVIRMQAAARGRAARAALLGRARAATQLQAAARGWLVRRGVGGFGRRLFAAKDQALATLRQLPKWLTSPSLSLPQCSTKRGPPPAERLNRKVVTFSEV